MSRRTIQRGHKAAEPALQASPEAGSGQGKKMPSDWHEFRRLAASKGISTRGKTRGQILGELTNL